MASDVLKLTGIITAGEQPNTFVGYIKEIGGIVSQGSTQEEAYENLVETTQHMIDVYKRPQANKLLAAQTSAPSDLTLPEEENFNLQVERELVYQ